MKDFAGRIAIVTGGGSGMGRELVRQLAAEAATIILDGVKADKWRILVGKDAHQIDERVRRSPEQAYDLDFFESFAREAGWRIP